MAAAPTATGSAIQAMLRRHALEAYRAVTGRHTAAGLNTAKSSLDDFFGLRGFSKPLVALALECQALGRKVSRCRCVHLHSHGMAVVRRSSHGSPSL